MYRAAALLAIQNNIDFDQEDKIVNSLLKAH
jgi:cytidylate kinase